MKVGVDTFGCSHGVSSLGSYLVSISESFRDSDTIKFCFFGAEIDRYTYASDNGLCYIPVSVPDSAKIEKLWHLFRCNKFVKKNKFDVVLFPAAVHTLSYNFAAPSVAVVNDIYSNLKLKDVNILENRSVKHGLKKVNKIIAASNFIKEDLVVHGFEADKIKVIYNGIDHSLFYPREIISGEYVDIKPSAIKKRYFIYSANMTTALKNHCELIKAFGEFKKNTGLPHRLVLSGAEGEYSEQVHRAVSECAYSCDIFMTGYFPHESLPELYAGSAGFIYPAQNEGVGSPVLEAMATGVPVACANSGALPEVSGGNTVLFDTTDIKDIACAMERLAVDTELCKKNIDNGLEWVKSFSWKKTAEQTIELLQSIVK